MKRDRTLIYSVPLAALGLIAASSLFFIAVAHSSPKPLTKFPPFFPILSICFTVLIYQLFSWHELSTSGITKRRLYFFTTTYAWRDLHKFCVIRWKGTSEFLLFFNGFESKVSISSPSINLTQLRRFINQYSNKTELLCNGKGKEWLSHPAA